MHGILTDRLALQPVSSCVSVREFADTGFEASLWEAYVEAHPQSTHDHRWAWRSVLSKTFGFEPHYLAAMREGNVAGILPLFRVPLGFGRFAFSSIPYGSYGGICADSHEAASALIRAGERLMKSAGAAYVEFRHRQPVLDQCLRPKPLYSRYVFPLKGDAQKHLKAMSQQNRYVIRRALRQGLGLWVSRDIRPLYKIHLHTMRRLGTPCFPLAYFESILKELKENVRVFYITFKKSLIAFELMFSFKQTLIGQCTGSLDPFFSYRPNNLLFWFAIEQGCLHGMQEFDFCRSRIGSGTAEFKRRLGMIEEPLAYQYHMEQSGLLPQRNPNNPKYKLAIQLWKRLPLGVTRLAGPKLVRYFA